MKTTDRLPDTNPRPSAPLGMSHEKILAQVFDHAPTFMCLLVGREHVYEMANRKFFEFTGFDDSILGKRVIDVQPDLEAQGFAQLLDRVYETGVVEVGTEVRAELDQKDGTKRSVWGDFVYQPLTDEQGEVYGVVVQGHDVTEKVRSKRAIEVSKGTIENERENFRNLFKRTPEMVCVLSGAEHRFEFVNEAHVKVLGFDATGMTIHEAQAESVEVYGILDRVYETGETAELREIPVTVTGRTRYFNFTFSARRDVQENVDGIMILGTEITDQVLSREGFKHQRDALESALNGASISEPLEVLARMVEFQVGGELVASVLLVDSEGKRLVNCAAPRLPQEYLDYINGVEIGPEVGSCGSAAFHKETVIVSDLETDPRWKPFKHVALRFGLRSCWSTPILSSSGKVLGTFAFYSKTVRAPSAQEFQIIEVTARTAALIIERQASIQALQESEERLNLALVSGNIGFWDWNVKSDLVSLSDTLFQEWQIDPKSFKNTLSECLERIHEEDRERVSLELQKAMSETVPYDVEYRVVRPLGEMIWVNAKGRCFRDSSGGLTRLTGITINITERKKFETALSESETRFRQLANAMTQLAWTAHPDGSRNWYNQRWYDYTGSTFEEMQGRGWEEVHHPEHRQRVIEFVKTAWEKPVPWELTFPLRRADGEWRWFLTRAVPLTNARGEIVQWFGTNTDITDQKILHSELARAKEEAERANQLKSAFLANMSHEIRTPLGVMTGFADLVGDPDITADERRQYVATLKRNGEMLSALVDDILDLSKVEAGHLKVEVLPFSLRSVLEDMTSAFKVKAADKGIELKCIVEDGIGDEIATDPVRLKQMLWNLVGNAIKFTQEGHVAIRVKDERGFIHIEVEDTGIGVSDSDRKKLFKPFSQADESMTRRFGGTGLGLVLSKRLAGLLGGDLELVSSQLGKGSVFKMTIANHKTSGSENRIVQEPVSHLSVIQPATVDLTGLRILVVDDSEDNQHLISRLLSKRGAVVELGANGHEAIEKAARSRHDLIIMDIQMPVMDGYTATQRMRELGYDLPIIALTAHVMNEVRQRCLDVGYTDYAPKPIDPSDLLRKIQLHARPSAH